MIDNQSVDSSGDRKNDGPVPEKPTDQRLELKRKVGLFSATSLIVGNMIGSGIFVTPSGVLRRSGSVGLSLVLWALCGVLAIFGSLTYAELGTLILKSGGEYAYFIDGLGNLHSFWGPLTAFLYSWIMILLLKPTSLAAGCLSIASYTVYPIMQMMEIQLEPDMEHLVGKLVAVIFLTLIIALNSYSVSWTVRVSNFLTVAKLMTIGILIGCGIYQLCLGQTQYLAQGFEGSTTDFGTIATALYGGLWAYDGWNNLNYVTEELKNPYVTLPRAIIIGIPLVTFCYVAVNIAYLTVLSPEEMMGSSAVAVNVSNRLLGPVAFIIPVAVVMSTCGSVLSGAFSTGRLVFASGREGHMVDLISYVHVDKRTPLPALLFECILAIAFIFAQDVATLIDFFTFTMWIFYVLAFILLLVLRKTRPDAPRAYKVPIIIPIIIIIIGCYLIVAPIISDPSIKYAYVLAVFFSGFLAYIPFVYYKYSFGFMVPLTRYIQLILNVGPTVKQ